MSAAQQQAFVLCFICATSALVLTVVLAFSRATRFGVFAILNLFLASALFGTQVVFGFSGWRSEILAASASELPVVFLVSWVCSAQAGGPTSRPGSPPSEPAVRRPWLRRVLYRAPAILLGLWGAATLMGLVWPSPAMQAHARAPVQFLLFKWPISLGQMIFATLATTVFVVAAVSPASAKVLRLRNVAFALSLGSLALIAAESALFAGVRFWAPDERRGDLIDMLLSFEAVAAGLSFATLALGLALRYTPAIAAAVVREAYTGWLPARERLEALGWHATAGGRTRGIARATYRIEEAAELVGLSRSDKEKSVATVQLMAVMRDTSSETGRITPQSARELYDLEKEILHDEALTSKISAFLGRRRELPDRPYSHAVPMQEALKAALDLSDNDHMDAKKRPLWFHLASIASVDVGLTDANLVRRCFGSQAEHAEAAKAYQTARDKLRSRTFGKL